MRRDVDEKDIFIECNFILKLSVTCTMGYYHDLMYCQPGGEEEEDLKKSLGKGVPMRPSNSDPV